MRSRWGLQGVVCFAINAALTIVLATLGVATAKDKVAKDQRAAGESKSVKDAAVRQASLTAKPLPLLAGPDPVYGNPLAPGMMKLVENEIQSSLRARGNYGDFARFQDYLAGRLYISAAPYTGSELTGNCRLRWYDHLLRNPLKAPAEAEEFTRTLHRAIVDDPSGLGPALAAAAEKLDLGKRKPRPFIPVHSPQEALEVVKQGLIEAQTAYAAALAPLSKSEIQELRMYLYPVMVGQNSVGHTLSDRGTGRRLCDLMEKMDRGALIDAANALVPITDPKLLAQLKRLPDDGDVSVPGVTGRVAAKIDTPAGAIVVGGKGNNVYRLDNMPGVAAVIDLGGDDVYYDGTVSPDRPVLLVIDLAGNDVYRSTKPGVQGGAILGVSMLLDLEGNDVYQAEDVAQGSCLAGIGILIDYAGSDRYRGFRRVQASALGGVGVLIDRGGHSDYHAAMWAQGHGAPLGFGMLEDIRGNSHYYCGGMFPNSYKPETPGYEGWGQGVGGGIRQAADGGVGVLLNGGGNNVYEFDYLSHGGGYWCGLGFERDFGGNNKCLICRKNFYGGERSEPLFQRFGCGWGCHYALGFCFDDAGNDVYEGTIMGSGMGWDCSVGALCNFGGGNHYEATGGLTQGCGAQASLGILFNYAGDDVYEGYGQGYAPPGISYHHLPDCGGNFSFLIDYGGGKNTYGCGADNNDIIQRGAAGGFLIDPPDAPNPPPATAKRTDKTAGP